ncbi:MAG: hypothetical protein ACYCSF_04515 [Acidimicrobiales bacterium]
MRSPISRRSSSAKTDNICAIAMFWECRVDGYVKGDEPRPACSALSIKPVLSCTARESF